MEQVGTVEQVWRYPVKSFQGEQVELARPGPGRRGGRPHAGRGRPGGRQGALRQALRRPAHGVGPARRRRGSCSPCPTGASTPPTTRASTQALSDWLGLDGAPRGAAGGRRVPDGDVHGHVRRGHAAVRLAGPARHLARPGRRPLADHRQPRPPSPASTPTASGTSAASAPPPSSRPPATGFAEEAWTHDRGRHRGQRGADAHAAVLDAVPGPAGARAATRPSARRSGTPRQQPGRLRQGRRRAEPSGWAIACTPASTSLATGGLAATCALS